MPQTNKAHGPTTIAIKSQLLFLRLTSSTLSYHVILCCLPISYPLCVVFNFNFLSNQRLRDYFFTQIYSIIYILHLVIISIIYLAVPSWIKTLVPPKPTEKLSKKTGETRWRRSTPSSRLSFLANPLGLVNSFLPT